MIRRWCGLLLLGFSIALAGTAQANEQDEGQLELRVHSRNSWSAADPISEYFPHKIKQISIHHTATASGPTSATPKRLRGIQRYHQQKEWPDIAYHFLIDQAGEVWALRPFNVRGDTSTSYDPAGHFLPVLEGNFEETDPTVAQVDALVLLLAWAVQNFSVPVETIKGHRDLAATLCPGSGLYNLIASKSLARRVSTTGTVTIKTID
jgi:hypothetical protein